MKNTVHFKNGSSRETLRGLYQWSYGQLLEIEGVEIDGTVWVQFSMNESGGDAFPVFTEVDNGVIRAEIPGFIFEKETTKNYTAYAFIYISDTRSGKTVKVVKMMITARPKPDDYIYTEPEKQRYEMIEERINELEENGIPGGGNIIVDSELSRTSENPVQNKVVANALENLSHIIPNKTSQLYNDSDFVTLRDLSGYAEKATTLEGYGITDGATKEDVKKLSEEIANQKEEMVKSVNGFVPNENGEVLINYENESDLAYRHEKLSKMHKKVTVYEENAYGYTNIPHVFMGKNYWPTSEYIDRSYTYNGVTFETDKHNIRITGTSTLGTSFRLLTEKGGSNLFEIPSEIVAGDKLALHVFVTVSEYLSQSVQVEMLGADGKVLTTLKKNVSAGENYANNIATVPEGAVYFRFAITFGTNMTYNSVVFPVLTKSNTEIINSKPFENGIATIETENEALDVCSAPYKSKVEYSLELKDYIDEKTKNNVSSSLDEKSMSFVSPEMFGAWADGIHDDTTAIQSCIDYAIANKLKVIAGSHYITSQPIRIVADKMSIDINQIVYSGTDSAVIVSGTSNHIEIGYIISDGVGFRLHSTAHCYHNHIYLGRLVAKYNAVEYIVAGFNIVCNNLIFGILQCGTGYACIYHSPDCVGLGDEVQFHNNNNFTGGKLTGGKWGVLNAKAQDTYMTCHFEGVDNCILQNMIGCVRVIAPRYVEVKMHSVDRSDPTLPIIEGKGIVHCIDITGVNVISEGVQNDCHFTLDAKSSSLYTTNIDITKVPTRFINSNGVEMPVYKATSGPTVINVELLTKGGGAIATNFILFANHILIKEPTLRRTKNVSVSDRGYIGDYRTTGDDDTEFIIYETFVVDESGCDYTLPPSYDNIAFNRFYVEQSEGTDCTFRDWRGTVVFNGLEYGSGMYEVTAKLKPFTEGDYYDNRNQVWEIRRMSDYTLVDTMPRTV